jgi:hypothetical protein
MTEVLYIEQPPDFAIQPGISSQSTQTRQILIKFVTALPATPPLVPNPVTPLPVLVAQIEQPSTAPGVQDFTGGINTTAPTDDPAWPVQPGDYLEVQGGGLMRQIVHVHPSYLELATPLVSPQPLSSGNVVDLTPTYRIIRGSRVLQGEEPLKLPNNVGIFKGIAVAYTNPAPPNQTVSLIQVPGTMVGTLQGNGSNVLEILFAPSGRVLSPNVDPIYLWVADESADDPTRQNQPVILSIKAATGFIANYPVDVTYAPAVLPPLPWPPTPYTPPNNPYIFAQSNRSGGL